MSARRTSNSSPSRSIRRWTIASNMKQSFGHGENASDSFMSRSRFFAEATPCAAACLGEDRDKRSTCRAENGSCEVDDLERGRGQVVDGFIQLPRGPVAPLDEV